MTTIETPTTDLRLPDEALVFDDAQLAAVALTWPATTAALSMPTATISAASSGGPPTTIMPYSRRPGPT